MSKRWKAEVVYRRDGGPEVKVYEFEEFEELGELIENGPHWGTISSFEVSLLRGADPDLTIEQAEAL